MDLVEPEVILLPWLLIIIIGAVPEAKATAVFVPHYRFSIYNFRPHVVEYNDSFGPSSYTI